MKRLGLIAVLSMLVVAVSAPSAFAQTVNVDFSNAPSGTHFRQQNVAPVCTTSTTALEITVSCTGTTLGGVGNTNADLSLALTATANFVCHNPGNDNIVDPHSDSVSDSVDATLTPSRNGQLIVPAQSVSVSAEDAAAQFECPNTNWREEFVGFSDASFTYSLTFVGFDDPALFLP